MILATQQRLNKKHCKQEVHILKLKYFISTVVILFTTMLSINNANAEVVFPVECTFAPGYSVSTSTLNLPAVVNIRAGTPVKTLLWDSGWLNGGNTSIKCAPGFTSTTNILTFPVSGGYLNSATLSPIGDGIYNTGIPGIGLKVFYSNSHDLSIQQFVLTSPRTSVTAKLTSLDTIPYYPASEYKVQFWSTGTYANGSTVFPSPLANVKYADLLTNQVSFTNTKFVVNLVGCTVSSSVNVDLGNVSASAFTGVGKTSDFKNFSIPLSCYAGTKISTTIDATQDSSNVAGVIKLLSQTNSATGLGVQLYYSGGSAVAFGTKTLFKSSSSTTESINLAARVYQTQKDVTVGKVGAVAYLTMTYE